MSGIYLLFYFLIKAINSTTYIHTFISQEVHTMSKTKIKCPCTGHTPLYPIRLSFLLRLDWQTSIISGHLGIP